jgi:hypothetical protein
VSVRSALTKGSDRVSLFSFILGVQLGIGALQGLRRPSEIQGCEPEQELKDCCCKCAQSRKDSST